MSKTDITKVDSAENATGNESYDWDRYATLGLVGLFDNIQGEALLGKLNIKNSIFVTDNDYFGMSPEWLMKHQD